MTLRRRVGLAAAVAVGVAVVLMAVVSYFVVRHQLRGQIDDALRAQAARVEQGFGLRRALPGLGASAGGPAPYAQLVLADGSVLGQQGNLALPVSAGVRAVAAGTAPEYMTDVDVGNSHLRVLVFESPVPFRGEGMAVELARPLNGIDHVLGSLRLILALLCLVGMALAAVLGRLGASRVLAPLAEVAATARHIGETEDLTSRIQVRSEDEVGQLARRFNAMVQRLESSRDALDQSVRAQRQLVADASHELRTPITSLRTNIELLLAHEHLHEEERRRMLTDAVQQSEELTTLIGDLIELARDEAPAESFEEVRLDRVVADSVARAQRNFPHARFTQSLEPALVDGIPQRLGRAVNNLLDNAARHSPPEGLVEVALDEQGLRVRDHGTGISAEDLPHVFDRFYRGAAARGRQGSGLGLAIVRQVAEQHHGSVQAESAPDGGALFTLRLPVRPLASAAEQPGSEAQGVGGLATRA